jgi:hypothetical protein
MTTETEPPNPRHPGFGLQRVEVEGVPYLSKPATPEQLVAALEKASSGI